MGFFAVVVTLFVQPYQEDQSMVVNMACNHHVQDMGSPCDSDEQGQMNTVSQKSVSYSSPLLVGCNERRHNKDNEIKMTHSLYIHVNFMIIDTMLRF